MTRYTFTVESKTDNFNDYVEFIKLLKSYCDQSNCEIVYCDTQFPANKGIYEDKWYSIKEAKEFLGIGINTVYTLVNNGVIKSVKIGNKSFISKSVLVDYVEKKNKFRIKL